MLSLVPCYSGGCGVHGHSNFLSERSTAWWLVAESVGSSTVLCEASVVVECAFPLSATNTLSAKNRLMKLQDMYFPRCTTNFTIAFRVPFTHTWFVYEAEKVVKTGVPLPDSAGDKTFAKHVLGVRARIKINFCSNFAGSPVPCTCNNELCAHSS